MLSPWWTPKSGDELLSFKASCHMPCLPFTTWCREMWANTTNFIKWQIHLKPSWVQPASCWFIIKYRSLFKRISHYLCAHVIAPPATQTDHLHPMIRQRSSHPPSAHLIHQQQRRWGEAHGNWPRARTNPAQRHSTDSSSNCDDSPEWLRSSSPEKCWHASLWWWIRK